ncbi:MAG: substrate-binding domain-containing protein, partial [Kiloniellales bacterium]
YGSDAASGARVRVVAAFPPGSHAPITYPLALVAGRDGPEARALYRFLQGPEARAIFRARGFTVPDSGPHLMGPDPRNRVRDAP